MPATMPIKLKEAFSLLSLGVAQTSLTFATTTLSSDRHIVVQDGDGNNSSASSLVILPTASPSKLLRQPFSADAALMHPSRRILALRMGVNLRLFDLSSRRNVQSVVLPEIVSYWRWINEEVLGIVTESEVFHWVIGHEPEVIFERHPSLSGSQVISYVSDTSVKWLAIVGISQQASSIVGNLQLFSVDKGVSQILPAHAATFAYIQLPTYTATLFVFASRFVSDGGKVESRLRIIEVGGHQEFGKLSTEIFYPPEYASDFPISVQSSPKFPSIVYLITKVGYLHLYDLVTAKCIYMNRVSDTTIFATTPHMASGGVMGINRKGQVLLMSADPDSIVPYVRDKLGDEELAHGIASRNGFAGAEAGFFDALDHALQENAISRAATLAAESPGGCLRTEETIARFKSLPCGDSSVPPVLIYIQTCLDRGTLNEVESIALANQLLETNKLPLLEKWIKEDKLEFTEELGDAIHSASPTLALAIYIKAACHDKAIQCMVETGQTSKVALYAKKVGMKVSHRELVDIAAKFDARAALDIANNTSNAVVLADDSRRKQSLSEISSMVDSFLAKGMLNEATTFAMENLRDEDAEEGPIQTKLLSACLTNSPAVADGILAQDIWHQFNSFSIAVLCERAGLFQHALEHFSDLSDVKRVITNTHVLNPEFILHYFSTIHPDDKLEVLKEILASNPRANIRLCVTIAGKYTDSMGGPLKVIPVFESVPKVPDALFYYLAAIVYLTDVSEVHNRFIMVAVDLQQYNDAERVTRESNCYDPQLIKNFLKRARPRDPRALINVCDRFGFVDELVEYFVKYNQLKFVEGYVQRINPLQAPAVVGALLDSRGMREDHIQKLIMSVKNMVPVAELVNAVQSRGKLEILLQFLESRLGDGSTDGEVHTGLAKVYVDTNRNAQHFLETNVYYDSREVGKFTAKRDPILAFIAYRRGVCDEEVLQLTNDNSLFREQACYAVDRADGALWSKIFSEDNPFRRLVVDQVISSAMPECKRPDKVSVAVKAFLNAGMPEVLMEMLEKLVMQTSNTAFARNTNLQNLLILTAIGADPKRVMEYVRRLDNYDGIEVAPSCVSAGLHEEAYTIYYKFEKFDDALDVLLEHIKDFDRAQEFAIRMDRQEVWLRLGVALLENGVVGDGIRALIRAKDLSNWAIVVAAARDHAESNEDFKMVCKFMRIARKKIRDPESAQRAIDTELVYGLCRLNALTDVEEFIITSYHNADLEQVGDRCFDICLFHAAKMMFRAVLVYSKLAHTHIELKEYKDAVWAARKANKIYTWRIVCFGCVDGLEFRLAAPCAVRLLVETSEMQECVDYYEERGHFGEIVDVLLSALNAPRAHEAMFTETVVLMTKYREEAVLNFCRLWHGRLNIRKVCQACTTSHLWDSVCFLYVVYNEYDNAANVMMDHSPMAFTTGEFLDIVSKVGSMNVMYRAIDFYLGECPELLEDLLNVLAPRIDGARAVSMLQRARQNEFGQMGCLPYAIKYLQKIQRADVPEVNEAINAVYIMSGDLQRLKQSVGEYRNFDQLRLAKQLESHELIQYRRLASELFARNGRHEKAIDMAERDKLYADMIYAIAESEDTELADIYAYRFANGGMRECFTVLLYACYEFFPPDVAMEYAWSGDMAEFCMPFLIQTLAEAGKRLSGLEEERRTKRETEELRKVAEEEEFVDPSILLYGLPSRQEQLMLTYHQAGGGYVGGGSNAFGVEHPGGTTATLPLLAWNPS